MEWGTQFDGIKFIIAVIEWKRINEKEWKFFWMISLEWILECVALLPSGRMAARFLHQRIKEILWIAEFFGYGPSGPGNKKATLFFLFFLKDN